LKAHVGLFGLAAVAVTLTCSRKEGCVVVAFVNVILMRQTCCQRSSRAAESKRRALENYFSERMYYMFLISKCAQLCFLRLENHSVMAKSDFSCVETYFFSGSFAGSSMCSNVRQVPCIPPQRSRLGLQNLGDTCYLQCLAHCSVLNPGQQV